MADAGDATLHATGGGSSHSAAQTQGGAAAKNRRHGSKLAPPKSPQTLSAFSADLFDRRVENQRARLLALPLLRKKGYIIVIGPDR